mmetsp:Transcript_3566/g.8755  ORF Transcript_3566/g.8755 Transcript_3566/m.8755 type:complete len:216 (+) Transcript_3566:1423-2070(+)
MQAARPTAHGPFHALYPALLRRLLAQRPAVGQSLRGLARVVVMPARQHRNSSWVLLPAHQPGERLEADGARACHGKTTPSLVHGLRHGARVAHPVRVELLRPLPDLPVGEARDLADVLHDVLERVQRLQPTVGLEHLLRQDAMQRETLDESVPSLPLIGAVGSSIGMHIPVPSFHLVMVNPVVGGWGRRLKVEILQAALDLKLLLDPQDLVLDAG